MLVAPVALSAGVVGLSRDIRFPLADSVAPRSAP
jgi:hypothetical protein